MINLVTPDNRNLFADDLDKVFRLRKRIFVDHFGWDVPHRDGREIDVYDTNHTLYLIGKDDDGRIISSARMVPTTGPHLLADEFPHLVDGEVPRGPHIWEISRYFRLPSDAAPDKVHNGQALCCSMIEMGLLFGITQFTTVVAMELFPSFLAFGWDVQPLGLSKQVEGAEAAAAEINITPQSLRNIREAMGINWPMLRYVQTAVAAA